MKGKRNFWNGSKLYTTELTWQNVNKAAEGLYECRYNGPLHNMTVARYRLIVHGISTS